MANDNKNTMIGTHDSFTFLKPRNFIFNIFSFLWRTQTKNIEEQKMSGTLFLDIRVCRYKGKWCLCHGIVKFNKMFDNLEDIVNTYSEFKLRILLEKGNNEDKEKFKQEISTIQNKYENLLFVAIKKNWVILKNNIPLIFDYTFVPFYSEFSFWENFKSFRWFNTIKNYAKTHKPKITQNMIDDKNIHFIDLI